MPAAIDRLDLAPPPQPGLLRGLVLAIIAHLLLMLALTWGINWKHDVQTVSAEAELWSAAVQQAAPKPAEAPPPPAPVVKEQPAPPTPPDTRQADIAVEQQKKKLAEEKSQQEERERQAKLAQQKQEDERKKEAQAKKAAEDRKKQEDQAKSKARQQEEAKRAEELRQENIRRAQGLAGATGSPSATGRSLNSSGPSKSYAGRIAGRIKPNIVFTDIISGNPAAEVEIRVAPDGTIVGRKLIKSSGVKSWDEAVLRAIDKTEILPRDTDGTVVPQFPITFRPLD